MAQKTVYIRANANETVAHESPLEKGVWHIPPKATEVAPPSFNAETQTCQFIDDKWVVEEIVVEEVVEATPATATEMMRWQRDCKLEETDYLALADHTLSGAMKTYRQKLRDVPSTASPKIDENGDLTNVTWPTKP